MFRVCFFFFSSRRRHTRYWRDWSSDVCSSDLIIPNVVLFPTPLPAKIPILCPSPQVKKPSIALTPVGNISFILLLFRGSGGHASIAYLSPPSTSYSSSSNGFPIPSRTFPKSSYEQLTFNAFPVGTTLHPGAIPVSSPKGIKITFSSLNPTTSQLILLLSVYIMQTSPTKAFIPHTSIVSPITFLTKIGRAHV